MRAQRSLVATGASRIADCGVIVVGCAAATAADVADWWRVDDTGLD